MVIITDEPVTLKETMTAASGMLKNLALTVSNHIIVPAAIILMVSAFLFYLLDVRSVYFGGTGSLKRIGFFFAAATVLIARYGKIYELRQRQAVYTGILAIATFLAMSRYSSAGLGVVINLVVVAAVWRFATGVTNKLDLVEEEQKKDEHRLYGVERLHHEEMERKYNVGPDRYASEKKEEEKKKKNIKGIISGYDAHGNPSASVARLAVLAVIAFAMGEPLILSGPPEVGQRALAAVIVFMLSTGIVLAAASAAGTFKHTIKSGGNASLSMIPLKIALSVILLGAILAVGVTVPGIKFTGSGRLQPGKHDKVKGSIKGQEDQKGSSGSTKEQRTDSRRQGSSKKSGQRSPGKSSSEGIFSFFTSLGKLLLIPLVLFFIGFIIYALYKLWPALKGWRPGIRDRLRKWLAKLREMMRIRKRKSTDEAEAHSDPLAAMGTISNLQPREAIITAYSCLLAFLDRAGHKRAPRLTPYEILSSLPDRLNYMSNPARLITDLYVNTVYSTETPSQENGKNAVDAVFKVQHLVESQAAAG
jgi:hypothetical protein